MSDEKRRAVIYCRMSTSEQADSPAQQEAACRAKAESLKLDIGEVYSDEGMSGSRLDRPQYHAMLEAAAKQFDCLLIWKLNRLGRNQVETERAICELEYHGVRVVAVDGYDTDTSPLKTRRMLRTITGVVDQNFIDNLSEDVHRGQASKHDKKVGYFMGGKPFAYKLTPVLSDTEPDPYGGFKKIGTTLVPDPEKAKIVVEIFEA